MAEVKKSRESNIELLRILAAMGVIILHVNNPGIGKLMNAVSPYTLNSFLVFGLEAVCICAVDLFMLISGYFSYGRLRVSVNRALRLLLQVSAFRVLFYVMNALLDHGNISLRGIILNLLPVNYFVVTYCTVNLLSPYINLVLVRLKREQAVRFVLLLLFLFSVLPFLTDVIALHTNWNLGSLSTVTDSGSRNGYTVVNYTLLFILGMLLRKTKAAVSMMKLTGLLLGCIGVTMLGGYGWHLSNDGLGLFFGYHSPFVIGSAVCIFLLIQKLHIGSNSFVNKLAAASFTVFLTHRFFLARMDVTRYAEGNPIILLGHLLLVCIMLYATGYILYLAYEVLAGVFRKSVLKNVREYSIDLSEAGHINAIGK